MDRNEYADLLIRMDQKLDDMMPRVGKIEAAIEKQRDTCSNRVTQCNRAFDQRVNFNVFRWIVGIMITAMVGMGIATTQATQKMKAVSDDLMDLRESIDNYHPPPTMMNLSDFKQE